VRAASFVAIAFAGCVGACDACSKPAPTDTQPDAGASAATAPPGAATSATAATTATAATGSAPHQAATDASPPPCRVMMAGGGVPASLDLSAWAQIPDGGRATIKSSTTGRELTLVSGAETRPCAGDVALITRGGLDAVSGPGEGPGSEQWVATPHAAMRWVSGAHKVRASAQLTTIDVTRPGMRVFVAEDVTRSPLAAVAPAPSPDGGATARDGFVALGPGHVELTWSKAVPAHGAATRGVIACEQAAAASSAIAQDIARAGAPQARLAEMHIVARGVARAACAVARARLGRAGDAALAPRVDKAEALFQAVVVSLAPAGSGSARAPKLPPR
jgi:hypothetical protein